jgi:hypothetical protein
MARKGAARAAPRSRMPKGGVQYPKGKAKAALVTRMRRAFSKVKTRQLEAN